MNRALCETDTLHFSVDCSSESSTNYFNNITAHSPGQKLRQSDSDRLMLVVCARNRGLRSGIICQSLLEAITGTLVVRVYCRESGAGGGGGCGLAVACRFYAADQ
jgi:hypothetical protein